jgi:hypothetical protein
MLSPVSTFLKEITYFDDKTDLFNRVYNMGNVWQTIQLIIYLLTAIGLKPSGSSALHMYTQTVHRTTQWDRIHRTEHT